MVAIDGWKASGSGRTQAFLAGAIGKHLPLFILPSLAIVVLALVAWTSVTYHIAVSMFTKDMAALVKFHPFVSVVSSLGAFLMCATATACLFTYAVARAQSRALPVHLLAAGLFSLYLTADDFYEFHERLFLIYFGVHEYVTYALIASAAVAISFRWRAEFFAFRPWLLFTALAFLALSLGCDVFDKILLPLLGKWSFFLEDSAKFIGISFWATYFMAMAKSALTADRDPVQPSVQADTARVQAAAAQPLSI